VDVGISALQGRIPGNRARRRAEEGPHEVGGDLTPEMRKDRLMIDAPMIGSTVASRKRGPAPRCADPCSAFRALRPEWAKVTEKESLLEK